MYEKPSGGSWTRSVYGLTNYLNAKLVPLTAGKVALVGQPGVYDHLYLKRWSGSSWVADSVSTSYAGLGTAGVVAIGDTVHFAGSECLSGCSPGQFSGVYDQKYAYSTGSWSSPVLVYSATSELTSTVSTDGVSLLSVSFFINSNKVAYATSLDSGVTWGAPSTMSTSEALSYTTMDATVISNNFFGAAWVSGGSPFNLKFAAFPVVVPASASTSKSWSRPGVSPYESYFAHLVEYISPGNGLLSIKQGDLQLPGRGMDLEVTRVFSTPYGFLSTAPFQYDNYTLSNLGYRWSLNFPWMGTNYLHLTDGQAYLYQWVSGTFEYHGAVDFKLVGSGGTYTLYMPSGTQYQFDSSKRLTSIVDHTGNNTISFSYGTNNYISSITDTASRTVTFGYDGSNHLTSMTSGGRTWSYAYSSGKLSTATDPLGRVTTYQYNTGINSWLVSAVLYPTSGKSTYTYGNSLVGTDVKTYYVTSRNLYSSPTSISLTSSISYNALNGNMVWSNSTISDGVSTQGYDNINFQSTANKMKEYQKNPSGLVIRTIESDYDSKGRINQTKTLDPALVGYWPLDENQGNSLYDQSGNGGNTGTLQASPTWKTGADCKYGSCLQFNGASQYVSFSGAKTSLDVTGTAISMSAWIYVGGDCDGPNHNFCQVEGKDSTSSLQYRMLINNARTLIYFVFWNGASVVNVISDSFTALSLNTWYHIAAIYDGAHVVFYKNGVQTGATKSQTGSIVHQQASAFQIGKTWGSNYYFNGRIDDPRVYNQAISAAQVSSLYSDVTPTGLTLAYSQSDYDSWGNLKYGRDNIGQQTWYSYANTDSSNSFGSSGCTASFYSQSISSNIHGALLGQCAYQNGSGSPQMQTYYKYDAKGNLLGQKRIHSGTPLYANYTNDRYGNVLSKTDALGRTTYYRYSTTYQSAYLTKQSIMAGTQNVTTTYTYDSAKGFLLSQTDPNGYATSYQYDGLGRLTLTTYPPIGGGSSTKQDSYDDTNRIITATDEDGNVVKQYYDGLGRQTKLERWNGSSVYSSETYTYNWLNAMATKTTAAGNTYTFIYDSSGRQTKLTNPDTTYQTASYDDVKNLKTATDENGHKTVYAYDWNGRITSVKEYNATTNYFLTSYSYDYSGNLRSMTDAKSQVTSYQYDDLNRLTTTTFPDTTTETRTYDSVGTLHSGTDPKGNTINYAYDSLNRLTTVTYPDSSTATYTYDPASNVKSAVNPSASDYYSYDPRNRPTNETEVVGSAYSTIYTYDGVGNPLSIEYPDGYMFSMTYDGVNRLKQVGTFATLAYTADDRTSKITYGDGEVQTYAYDSRDRPTRILDKYGSTTEMDLNYTYDGTGNVLTLNTESYGYDWLDRLTSTTGPWGTITYSYDQVGNRVKMVQGGTTTNYAYASFNRLTSAGSTTYTYDANGNTITKNDGTSWTYSYDYEDRMTSVVHSNATVQQNFYDAGGFRVKKVETNATVYAYQGLNTLYERDLTSGTITKRFYANGQQVAKTVGSSTYYLHADHLGSTRLVMSSTVTVVFSSNYVPYGVKSGASGSEVFTYTGKPYDSITGLYYFGARYYDAGIGRFVTEDILNGSPGDAQGANLYEYARSDPMKFVDPNGRWVEYTSAAISPALTAGEATLTGTWSSQYDGLLYRIHFLGEFAIGTKATSGLTPYGKAYFNFLDPIASISIKWVSGSKYSSWSPLAGGGCCSRSLILRGTGVVQVDVLTFPENQPTTSGGEDGSTKVGAVVDGGLAFENEFTTSLSLPSQTVSYSPPPSSSFQFRSAWGGKLSLIIIDGYAKTDYQPNVAPHCVYTECNESK